MVLPFLFFFQTLVFSEVIEKTLSNENLAVTWQIDSGSLTMKNLINNRTDTQVTVIPQSGSEEFTISILRENPSSYPTPISDKSKWKIYSNSEKNKEGNDGPISNLIDNDPNTIWHTWESEKDDEKGHDDRPNHIGDYNITIDLGEKLSFKAISFTQKPINVDGVVRKFKLFVGDTLDEVTEKVKNSQFELDSYFAQDKNHICYLNLTKEVSCQFIVITTAGDGKFGTGAQFDIYTDYLPYVNDVISSSALNCVDSTIEDDKLTFKFDTFSLNGANFDIVEVVELVKDKPYLEKHLEIKCSDENVKIDYIDLDHYVISSSDLEKSWTCPFVDELFMSLGQPFYMNTFYAGCRFPYVHTMIESTTNLARIRYYSGKQFKDFKKNDQGAYVTWKTVLGAARDSRIEVVRNDFFSYITDISVPSPFRKQFNSWYDWMLGITEENIMTSFKEIERGCTQYGLPPFDSYVVDDGWNNYNTEKYGVYDPKTSGTTYNQEGFWEFNNKFPNKFENPSAYTRKISSNFGVWLGPRGGYVTPGKFGKMIEDANGGFYNSVSDDIDVASHTYLRKVQQLLVDFIQKYKVNYYKLDGFVEQPCFNESHDHMVGGPDGLYFFTDLWENIYIWYEDMINTAKEANLDNFWISTTTWAAPSPFQLQWSNSIWIQISYDKSEIIIGNLTNQADQMLTYRDDCYWQFYEEMQLQFPARCLYNHDPIYGQAGTTLRGSLDDDYFRTFLYGCAMRGTAFFELYYTYDMLDEGDKWYVSSDVLSWAENSFDTLQHSQLFGGRPGIGEYYGFSAWNKTNGVIGIRNPGKETVKWTIKLDRNLGVPEAIGTVYRSTLLEHRSENMDELKNKVQFKYNDDLEVTLVPGEYRIYEFKPSYEQQPPEVEVLRSTKENEIMIRFNRRVKIDQAVFSIEGLEILESRLRGDRRTITITTSPMTNYTNYKLVISKLYDIYDNEFANTVEYQYYSYNTIASIKGEFSGTDEVILSTTTETDSFTIRLNVLDFKNVKDAVLLHSEDDSISVKITNDNHISFTVGETTVVSEEEIKDTHFITLVRERNALIKIYFDTEIDSSEWDKKMPKSVVLHNIILNKNDVVYKYVKIFNYAFAYSEVSKEVSLKNEYIERVFSIANNKVKTLEIINKRTEPELTITPQEGSEEFVFSIPAFNDKTNKQDVYRVKNDTPTPIDRSGWKISANSEQTTAQGKQEGPVGNLIDGNINTIWHSYYRSGEEGGHEDRTNLSDPFQIIIDLGKVTEFKAFSHTPRQSGTNGIINNYEIYVANTREELDTLISQRKYTLKGVFHYYSTFPVYVNFTQPQKGQFVGFLAIDNGKFGTGADFSLYADYVPPTYFDIKSSYFDLESCEQIENENGQKIIFVYKPYTFNKVQYNVTVEYELKTGKHYIEKQISIRIPEDVRSSTKIDYLELDHFVITDEDKEKTWTHPFVEPKRGDLLSKFIIVAGQPVYMNSFFTGCRFPFSDNQLVDNDVYIRYHSGKTFDQLKLQDGTYYCWKTVIGAARSSEVEVERKDFYDYIHDISVEINFRKQYNSWYDWMLTINESNILSSFKEIEKGCTQHGVPPLDSYVIDDGWNIYNSEKYHVYDEPKSGTSYNDAGFWEMNTKFPEGFTKPSDFSRKVSSDFGVWLGPRGGYNYYGALAHMIEDAGNGYFNAQGGDIDVASAKYTKKLGDFWNDWIKQYKVNYYKLDGWVLSPCTNPEHDHMVGGYESIYLFTDYWERYIDIFESMRQTAVDSGVNNLWISLTCYINPSPFHLQWANSIWVQISNDVGYTKITDKDTLADQMLNYRDNVYYEFYNTYQFQFPQQSIYNHDPIYGQTGTQLKGSLDDAEFRRYLLMCGMRGTSFFELYYTYTMIDEGDKWYVNSEVLKYIEERHEVLKHSQLFGGAPGSGEVYGYSAWIENKGTIAIRNPSNDVKEFTIKLDRTIGVPETLPPVYRKIVLDFNTIEDLEEGKEQNYNDEIKVTLQPRETRIIDFEPTKDDKCAEIEVIKSINQKEIQVRFNKKIRFDLSNYQIEGNTITDGKLRGDLRTVSLYLQDTLKNNTEIKISFKDVKDSIGNVFNKDEFFTYMSGNMIVTVPNELGPIDQDSYLNVKKFDVESFTIQLNIKSRSDNEGEVVLISDRDNDVNVKIVDGKVKFNVKDVVVVSSQAIATENVNVTCVRERNTMLKLYINGELTDSKYKANQDLIVSLEKILICPNSVVYNTLSISSFAYSYKDAQEANNHEIRINTATAEATSFEKDHEPFYAIDDNNLTYWISQREQTEKQSITVSLDRVVHVNNIKYIPHDAASSITDYVISVSKDQSSWVEFPGTWGNSNDDEKVAKIDSDLKYVKLEGVSSGNSQISVAHLIFDGYETKNEDVNPTPPPPETTTQSPLPTQTPSLSPSPSSPPTPTPEPTESPEPSEDGNKGKVYIILGISVAVISVVAIVAIVICLKKKSAMDELNSQPLISYQ